MSERTPAGVRLKPTPVDAFRFADAATDLRYRLVINYLGADPDAGEVPPPKVVRETFQKLLAVTLTINDRRPEDQKLEGHVIAGRGLVDGFERKWLDRGHRLWLEDRQSARQPYGELNEYDLADIRRNGPAGSDPECLSSVDAEALLRSPFGSDAWQPFEEAVGHFVDTFDAPCRILYRLVSKIAEVCYPNPATYDATLGTLPVYDDEHLIKHLRPEVNQLLAEFQSLTCFHLNFGEWFDAANPYGSFTRLYSTTEETLRAWNGEVAAPPELDRPRWEPAPAGSGHKGTLAYRGKMATVAGQSRLVEPMLVQFEAVGWEKSVPVPAGTQRPSRVLDALKKWAAAHGLPLSFEMVREEKRARCRWFPIRQVSEQSGAHS